MSNYPTMTHAQWRAAPFNQSFPPGIEDLLDELVIFPDGDMEPGAEVRHVTLPRQGKILHETGEESAVVLWADGLEPRMTLEPFEKLAELARVTEYEEYDDPDYQEWGVTVTLKTALGRTLEQDQGSVVLASSYDFKRIHVSTKEPF